VIVFAVASELELRDLRRRIDVRRVEVHGGRPYCFGRMQGRDVCLVRTGAGRKNAAAAARRICSEIQPELVIITGAAGALDPSLKLGAAVVVEAVVQENSSEEISCPDEKVCRSLAVLNVAGMKAVAGHCCQVATFMHRAADKRSLYERTRAHVVDMESAAFGYAFQRAGVPFVNVRVVSDTARRDTADMEKLVRLRNRVGRMGSLVWLCLRPRELLRAWFFYRGMGVAAVRISDVLRILVGAVGLSPGAENREGG